MLYVSRVSLSFVVLGWLAFVAGCAPKSDTAANGHTTEAAHEHGDEEHHHPETYAEAITLLGEMRTKIRDAFAKEDIDTAHGPLHDIGHILEDLPELAEKHGHVDEALAVVKEESEKLLDLFGKVDAKLHGDEGAAYDEVSADIDASLARLEHPETKPAATDEAAPTP